MRTRAIALTSTLLLLAGHARAASVDQRLQSAPSVHERKVARVHGLRQELVDLRARYVRFERVEGHVTIRLIDALASEREASARLADARRQLDERARAAYMLGPGSELEAFLSAGSLSDLATVPEFTSRALGGDVAIVDRLRAAEAALRRSRADAERAQAALLPEQRRLGVLLAAMRAKVAEAERVARQAGLQVTSLERQRRSLESAAQRLVGRNLLGGDAWTDQRDLLALLGPNEGRGCALPPGLQGTGKSLSGLASYYGWNLAGSGTASGAIFDPRLFTAANRWLPLGTFLRVHYRGQCAIVLVNDRGPYGDYARVIDLSWAAAKYLGVGVSPVTADILVPR